MLVVDQIHFPCLKNTKKITPVLQAITDTSITGLGDPKLTLYQTYVNSTWA